MRGEHDRLRTEATKSSWIRRFILANGKRPLEKRVLQRKRAARGAAGRHCRKMARTVAIVSWTACDQATTVPREGCFATHKGVFAANKGLFGAKIHIFGTDKGVFVATIHFFAANNDLFAATM